MGCERSFPPVVCDIKAIRETPSIDQSMKRKRREHRSLDKRKSVEHVEAAARKPTAMTATAAFVRYRYAARHAATARPTERALPPLPLARCRCHRQPPVPTQRRNRFAVVGRRQARGPWPLHVASRDSESLPCTAPGASETRIGPGPRGQRTRAPGLRVSAGHSVGVVWMDGGQSAPARDPGVGRCPAPAHPDGPPRNSSHFFSHANIGSRAR